MIKSMKEVEQRSRFSHSSTLPLRVLSSIKQMQLFISIEQSSFELKLTCLMMSNISKYI